VKEDRITLVIEGLPEDSGRVRLNTFVSQVQKLSAALAKLDRDADDGKPNTYFEIVELSYSSPIRVSLEPQAMAKHPYLGSVVVESLRQLSTALESGADLSKFDAELLEDIRGLAKPVGKTVKAVALVFEGNTLDLTPRIAANVESALAVDEECDGSVDGMLEQINIHLGANTFHIYPAIGPRKISCSFPPALYDDAVAAVGKRVEVNGLLRYRANTDFPHQIVARSIEIFPPESELPDWEDLRGRAPNATNGMKSEDFVRELRDAWV
jgi:hypothetical protein